MTVPAVWQRRVLGGGWARIPTRSLLCPNRLAKPATRVIIAY
jgi:hypothetical protein